MKGKIVTVVLNRNNVFDWQQSCEFVGEVLHTPGATGDWFHFMVDGVGRVMLNPVSAEFVGIVEEPDDGE